MKKHCIAMLLAGGQGSRLYALTAKVAKPSIPFGGKYRIIDFPLSNCANSGIDTVGVLTQYQPLLLNRYIGTGQAWDLDSIDGGVYILPPYQSAGERGSWFSGTANAIYQNMDFIDIAAPDHPLLARRRREDTHARAAPTGCATDCGAHGADIRRNGGRDGGLQSEVRK